MSLLNKPGIEYLKPGFSVPMGRKPYREASILEQILDEDFIIGKVNYKPIETNARSISKSNYQFSCAGAKISHNESTDWINVLEIFSQHLASPIS